MNSSSVLLQACKQALAELKADGGDEGTIGFLERAIKRAEDNAKVNA